MNKTISKIWERCKAVNRGKLWANLATYAVLILFALTIIIPFYVMFINSLKESHALATQIPFVWFPSFTQLSLRAYGNLFTTFTVFATGRSMVLTGIINTMIVVIPNTIIGMLASSISAYAFAKINFRLKNVMFYTLMFSMMLPGVITLIPSYIIFDSLYLTNTFFPLMAPAMFGSAACVFFLRQFFSGIPDELLDAGKIDGMNWIGLFFRIMLPLSVPALLAQGVLGFVAGYNDYLGPLLYITDESKYTLQMALQMFTSGNMKDLPTIMAGAVLALIPTLAIYVASQRYFITGIAMSGLKG